MQEDPQKPSHTLATWRGPTTLVANAASISCESTDCSVACEPMPALLMSRFKPWPSRQDSTTCTALRMLDRSTVSAGVKRRTELYLVK